MVKAYALYPKLTESEIKTLVVDDKWLAVLDVAIHSEMDRVSQQVTQRVRESCGALRDSIAGRCASCVAKMEDKVNRHLERMGFAWT